MVPCRIIHLFSGKQISVLPILLVSWLQKIESKTSWHYVSHFLAKSFHNCWNSIFTMQASYSKLSPMSIIAFIWRTVEYSLHSSKLFKMCFVGHISTAFMDNRKASKHLVRLASPNFRASDFGPLQKGQENWQVSCTAVWLSCESMSVGLWVYMRSPNGNISLGRSKVKLRAKTKLEIVVLISIMGFAGQLGEICKLWNKNTSRTQEDSQPHKQLPSATLTHPSKLMIWGAFQKPFVK